jgi:hypothetical protein
MRCSCCNRNLSDYESTLRSATTGDYLDTCKKCLQDLNIPTLKNTKHSPDAPAPDDDLVDFDEIDFGEEDE